MTKSNFLLVGQKRKFNEMQIRTFNKQLNQTKFFNDNQKV